VFNFQGSEVIIILLLALVVLGPEKLPDAMRKAGQMYGELKKMSSSFQSEFRSVVDEPLREVRETANLLRDSADFRKLQDGERSEKPKSADMTDAPDGDTSDAESATDPVTDLPFSAAATDVVPTEAPVEDADGLREAGPLVPPTSTGGPAVVPDVVPDAGEALELTEEP
jgi:sec-independent protein translocase protein TatB